MSEMPEECEVIGCHNDPMDDLYDYSDTDKTFYVCGGCFAQHTIGKDVKSMVKEKGVEEVDANKYHQFSHPPASRQAEELKSLEDMEDTSIKAALAGQPTTPEGEPSMYEREIRKRYKLMKRLREEVSAIKLLRTHNCDNHWDDRDMCSICGRDGRV